jgi:hypothetical protein
MNRIWRVWKNSRFAGYVQDPSESGALEKAMNKFGSSVWVERISR